MTISHLTLRQAVVDGANFLVKVGAISMSHHGNFSVRVPNTDTILLTATSSFDNLKPENLALLDLEGRLLEGEINPTNAEIVHMHAVVYKQRPETGAVVHTHSTSSPADASTPQADGLQPGGRDVGVFSRSGSRNRSRRTRLERKSFAANRRT